MNWEQIDYNHQRAKVPGGWLVKAFENVIHESTERGFDSGYDWRVAMCFLPDPDHTWQVGE